jgi:hypothetical protein
MASKSVAVLSSWGRKLGYKTYKLAMADVEAGIAVRESERCIRLVPSAEGVEWRARRSGRYGPIVPQMERPFTDDEQRWGNEVS